MEIRHGKPEDNAALAQIECASYPPQEGASRETLQARLAVYPNHFWILEENGRILGFVNGMTTDQPDLTDEMYDCAQLHRETGAWQMIFSVVTAPECRGRGYASRLLRQVIAQAREEHRRGLVLTCKESLVKFYCRFGFVEEGISASTHGNVRWMQMRHLLP